MILIIMTVVIIGGIIMKKPILVRTMMMFMNTDRRKFRSQITDLWTDAETVGGTVNEERVGRKKIKMRGGVERWPNTVFLPLLQPWKVEKLVRSSGGCRAMRQDERSKVASGCGTKHVRSQNGKNM